MPLMNDDCKNRDNFQSSTTTTTDSEDDRKNADKYESVQKTSPDSVVYSKNADKFESFQQDTAGFDDDSKMWTNMNLFKILSKVLVTMEMLRTK